MGLLFGHIVIVLAEALTNMHIDAGPREIREERKRDAWQQWGSCRTG